MSSTKPVVAVLMSTYNGEKYIREQLNSIFAQRGVVIKLYVRDDGSTDSTLDILMEYKKKYPMVLLENKVNLGAGHSFMYLLYRVALEPGINYFAFADQDNIWLEDKLIAAVNCIENCDKTGPVLYTSNQYLYTNGINTGKRFKEYPSISLPVLIAANNIYGCTFVFNKDLAEMMIKTQKPVERLLKYRYHDTWVLLSTIVCGHVLYDNNSYILYRIHHNNLVGVKNDSLKKRLGKLKHFLQKGDDSNLRMLTAQQLLVTFPDMDINQKKFLELYANYQNSWKEKWRLLNNKEVLDSVGESPFIFKIKVLMNYV